MSGLAGVFNLDGHPVEPERLEALVRALAHRGPDGTSRRCLGEAALGHLALHATPESVDEIQPWCDEDRMVWVVLAGRLDNRRELHDLASAKGRPPRNATDVELVLRSYQVFGLDFASRLLGDFAILIWDAREKRLVGARDVVGERPFYYAQAAGTVFVASEPRALLTQPEISRQANESMVAQHLADHIVSTEETLYSSILRLPPAHLLIASAEGVRTRRYWAPDPGLEIRYRRDEEYAEHLREIIGDAVRCRLRSQGPVAADLSGGMDSSSVVAMIHHLDQTGALRIPRVEHLSLVFPGEVCDESRWIESVERRWRIRSSKQPPTPSTEAHCREQVAFYRDLPDYPNGAMSDGLRQLARQLGCRVRLTGLGGDEWLAGSPLHLSDQLRRLQLIRFLRQLRADSGNSGTSQTRLLLRAVAALLPSPVRSARQRLKGPSSAPPWIGPALQRHATIDRSHSQENGQERFRSHASRAVAGILTDGFAIHRAEMEERAAAAAGLELREPLNDRRIVEFALALPEEQRWRGPVRKVVLRHAMRDLLPPDVLARTWKPEFSSVFVSALAAADPDLFFAPQCARRGWVDADESARLFRQLLDASSRREPAAAQHLWPMWKLLSIEIWYQLEYNGSSGATI